MNKRTWAEGYAELFDPTSIASDDVLSFIEYAYLVGFNKAIELVLEEARSGCWNYDEAIPSRFVDLIKELEEG